MNRIALLAICLLPASAWAQSCEDSFRKSGNALIGTQYSAAVTVAGLNLKNAAQQLRVIGNSENLQLINDDGEHGSMLFELPQTMAHSAIPHIFTMETGGDGTRVELQIKTKSLAFAKTEAMRSEMCTLLARLTPGAAPAATTTVAKPQIKKQPSAIFALELDQAMRTTQNPELLQRRYEGRQFQLSGLVSRIERAPQGGFEIYFMRATEMSQLLLEGMEQSNTHVVCFMAPNQSSYALSLNHNEKIELLGTFLTYKNGIAALQQCQPVKK